MQVLRHTDLCSSFEDVPKDGIRRLKETEVLEVLSWPQELGPGLMRLRVKAKLDGASRPKRVTQSKSHISCILYYIVIYIFFDYIYDVHTKVDLKVCLFA